MNQFTFHQPSTHLIILRCGNQTIRWLLQPGEKRPVLLDDRRLRRELPDYADLTLKGRRKAMDRYLKGLPVALRARIDASLPNAGLCILGRSPCRDDFRVGADAFLRLLDLFEDPEAGAILAANLLCGFQMATLRRLFPTFCRLFPSRKRVNLWNKSSAWSSKPPHQSTAGGASTVGFAVRRCWTTGRTGTAFPPGFRISAG